MALTQEQLEIRKTRLTASDWAAVTGLDPYRNAVDVYLEKTGKAEPFQGNEYTHFGEKLEPVILSEYADRMGVVVTPGKTVIHPELDWVAATPDGIVDGNGAGQWGVEAKNRNAYNAAAWGEPGTDEIPDEVAVQCHIGMEVTGLKRWDAVALIGGNRLSIYTIERDQEVIDGLLEVGRDFWENHVLADVCPELDGTESSSQYVANKWKTHGDLIIPATPEIYDTAEELRLVRAELKETEETKERLQNLLKDAIGEAAGVLLPDGKKITWKRPKPRQKTGWKAFAEGLKLHVDAEVWEDLHDTHTTEQEIARTFRVPRNW